MELNEKKKILIVCTGNSCRSQIAEGFARQAGWQAYSAGTKPELAVNPFAISVMMELGIDISQNTTHSVNEYLSDDFHLVVTVCDNSKKNCPFFTGSFEHQIHHGFEDPANATGTDNEITKIYRLVRDKIKIWIDSISEDYLNDF